MSNLLLLLVIQVNAYTPRTQMELYVKGWEQYTKEVTCQDKPDIEELERTIVYLAAVLESWGDTYNLAHTQRMEICLKYLIAKYKQQSYLRRAAKFSSFTTERETDG